MMKGQIEIRKESSSSLQSGVQSNKTDSTFGDFLTSTSNSNKEKSDSDSSPNSSNSNNTIIAPPNTTTASTASFQVHIPSYVQPMSHCEESINILTDDTLRTTDLRSNIFVQSKYQPVTDIIKQDPRKKSFGISIINLVLILITIILISTVLILSNHNSKMKGILIQVLSLII